MGGTSGVCGDRLLVVTASARSRLLPRCGFVRSTRPIDSDTWQARASFIGSPPPMQGTWTRSRQSMRASDVMARWPQLPEPMLP